MKRNHREDDDNPDRWLVSYADFITLLFAFFTTMYAISQVDAGKLKIFTGSMRSAFKSSEQQSIAPVIEGFVPVTPEIASVEHELRGAINALKSKEDMEINRDDRGLVLSICDNVLFDVGRAAVRPDAESSIAAVAAVLQKIPNRIVIEGHTDNLPLHDSHSPYASNWELSTARATQVLDHLLRVYHLPPERLSASGYAEYRPKATNATPEGRARNRRVDVIILGKGGK